MTAFILDDCFRVLGMGGLWKYCGSVAFIFALGILRKVARSGPNTQDGRRDLGLWSSASSQSALQSVRHAPAYLMLLYLGCCTALSPPVFQRVAGFQS